MIYMVLFTCIYIDASLIKLEMRSKHLFSLGAFVQSFYMQFLFLSNNYSSSLQKKHLPYSSLQSGNILVLYQVINKIQVQYSITSFNCGSTCILHHPKQPSTGSGHFRFHVTCFHYRLR